jgi:alpha-glucosidase
MSESARSGGDEWWRHAVVYQLYPRSFADANGDGVGDLAGIRSHLDYLAGLGVDAVWINPWYPSPMADSGYDVSDYRSIEPSFGTLDDAEALITEAHAAGLRVLLDIVPNHTSDQHPWFVEALASAPDSSARQRYVFRDGRGPDGAEPPNDWSSQFGGPAWTRVIEADGRPGQWYLHLFTSAQPDLNWANPEVRTEFEDILRFWFDRGVDGFRIDVAHGLVKDPALADLAGLTFPLPDDAPDGLEHPHWDQPGIHEIFQGWRRVADSYSPPRVFCGEIWVGRDHRLAAYLRPDELHTAFNFRFLVSPWLPDQLRERITGTLAAHAAVGAPPTWVLGNHDVCRPSSRYAREQRVRAFEDRTLSDYLDRPADRELGLRRARAAALLSLALPGSAYIYNGEELGLPEVEDLPVEALQDPVVRGTAFADRGRDGCRVPLPWTTDGANYGFSPEGGSAPWLPQPAGWGENSVQAQHGRPGSTLELYRTALTLRRELGLGTGQLTWLDAGPQAVAFTCGDGVECWVNLGAQPLPLPDSSQVLVASAELDATGLGPDTAVWLRR